MAQADFTAPTGVLTSEVLRVESAAFTPPNGGGTFVQAYKTVSVATGVRALFYNGAGFAPTPTNKGGIASMALQRSTSGGATGWAPFVFACFQGTDVSAAAYILGISDATPGHLVLRKGALTGGLADVVPGSQGVLWRSNEVFDLNAWAHVQLMVAGNSNGDAVISLWENDLGAHVLGSPVWTPILGTAVAPANTLVTGVAGLTDDGAGIVTGSPGYTNGRFGFGVYFSDVARVALLDGFHCEAQP